MSVIMLLCKATFDSAESTERGVRFTRGLHVIDALIAADRRYPAMMREVYRISTPFLHTFDSLRGAMLCSAHCSIPIAQTASIDNTSWSRA